MSSAEFFIQRALAFSGQIQQKMKWYLFLIFLIKQGWTVHVKPCFQGKLEKCF